MTLDERKLMDEMSRSILMTRAEIGLRSGFSKDKTTRILNALASRGLVAREGSGRGTRYRRVSRIPVRARRMLADCACSSFRLNFSKLGYLTSLFSPIALRPVPVRVTINIG